jgi:hypothetical protein
VPGFREHANEPLGSIKFWECLERLDNCWLPKKNSAVWSCLVGMCMDIDNVQFMRLFHCLVQRTHKRSYKVMLSLVLGLYCVVILYTRSSFPKSLVVLG